MVINTVTDAGDEGYTARDTYLNGHSRGWPHNHSVEDTYDVPRHTWKPNDLAVKEQTEVTTVAAKQYTAEFRHDGSAVLVFHTSRDIAKFDTFADAQKAAAALNNQCTP